MTFLESKKRFGQFETLETKKLFAADLAASADAPVSIRMPFWIRQPTELNMKRLLSLLLVMVMVGCGDSAAPLPEASATSQPEVNATPPPDAATVKQTLTPAQLAVGDPIENSIGMLLVPIPAGEFLMGSPETEPGRGRNEVQHQVTLTQPFLLAVHEVTQGQWQAVMGTTPWKGESDVKEGDDYPATYVNWQDMVEFCHKLSEKEGSEYRLPTEAE